jgi:hypothetical protein
MKLFLDRARNETLYHTVNGDRVMKIFCLGLSKTATTSLADALTILGYKTAHWTYTRHVLRYTSEGIDINFDKFKDYDAFADTPIARIYKELDKKYPGSKFILTLRDVSKWEKSFQDQFGNGTPDKFSARLHMDLYGTDSYDHEKCVKAFNRHTEEVMRYFSGREKDLLIMDITKKDGWDKLCPFLDKPVPNIDFPIKYTKEERRFGYRLRRLLRNPREIPGKIMLRLNKLRHH